MQLYIFKANQTAALMYRYQTDIALIIQNQYNKSTTVCDVCKTPNLPPKRHKENRERRDSCISLSKQTRNLHHEVSSAATLVIIYTPMTHRAPRGPASTYTSLIFLRIGVNLATAL